MPLRNCSNSSISGYNQVSTNSSEKEPGIIREVRVFSAMSRIVGWRLRMNITTGVMVWSCRGLFTKPIPSSDIRMARSRGSWNSPLAQHSRNQSPSKTSLHDSRGSPGLKSFLYVVNWRDRRAHWNWIASLGISGMYCHRRVGLFSSSNCRPLHNRHVVQLAYTPVKAMCPFGQQLYHVASSNPPNMSSINLNHSPFRPGYAKVCLVGLDLGTV